MSCRLKWGDTKHVYTLNEMKKQLTYKDEKSDKFWQIEVAGKVFSVIYGKTGEQTRMFANEATK
jgi:predicted DNA-binding WGR domain protein